MIHPDAYAHAKGEAKTCFKLLQWFVYATVIGFGIWGWLNHSDEQAMARNFYVKCYAAAPQFRSFDSDACDELWAAAGHDNSGYSTSHAIGDIGFSGYSSDEE